MFSALTLAGAGVVVKAGQDVLVSRAILSTSAAMLMLPVALMLPMPDAQTWVLLGISVPTHAFYQFCLIKAFHRGDLSLVFPVMRGLAPVLTAIGAYFVLQESLSLVSVIGLAIASAAVVSFAFLHQKPSGESTISRTALLWAGATAIGIMLYNVADARGVRLAPNPFTFIAWLFLLDWIAVSFVAVISRKGHVLSAIQQKWRYGLVGGVFAILSYSSTLWAFRLTEAAHVAALRETAVIIGALLGWVMLKEGMGPRRTVAAIVMAMGLGLMQIGT